LFPAFPNVKPAWPLLNSQNHIRFGGNCCKKKQTHQDSKPIQPTQTRPYCDQPGDVDAVKKTPKENQIQTDNARQEQRPNLVSKLKEWFRQFFHILYEDLQALLLGKKADSKPDEPTTGSCCKPGG